MIEELLQYTYQLDNPKIKRTLNDLWREYENILDDSEADWSEMNRARAILYFIGYLYPEQIAIESLEKRVAQLVPSISLLDFLFIIDHDDKIELDKYKGNEMFDTLREFYLTIKEVKNRIEGDSYLDETRFNTKYDSLKPEGYF